MKIILVLLAAVLFNDISIAQKRSFTERTLQEMDSLVSNSLEFLGKTESEILAAKRPASIMGGDEWKVEVIKPSSKNSMDASKTILIGTGCGAMMIIISAKTNLAYVVTFIAHKKAKLDGEVILSYFNTKYQFDKKGTTIIQDKDGSYIGMTVLAGSIITVALQEDKKQLRFEN